MSSWCVICAREQLASCTTMPNTSQTISNIQQMCHTWEQAWEIFFIWTIIIIDNKNYSLYWGRVYGKTEGFAFDSPSFQSSRFSISDKSRALNRGAAVGARFERLRGKHVPWQECVTCVLGAFYNYTDVTAPVRCAMYNLVGFDFQTISSDGKLFRTWLYR